MATVVSAMLAYLRVYFISRHTLALETVALRQQLTVYKRKHPRPKLRSSDRLFWFVLRSISHHWSEALIVVRSETMRSPLCSMTLGLAALLRFMQHISDIQPVRNRAALREFSLLSVIPSPRSLRLPGRRCSDGDTNCC